jgi:ATP-dependent DNA ligase
MTDQLCQLAMPWTGAMPEGGAMAELKHDGFRCLFFRGIDDVPRLWTRNGMPIEGCDHILHRLLLIERAAGRHLFVDGELVVDGTLEATKRWIERDWRKGGDRGTFFAFDVVPFDDWRRGGSAMPLFERKAWLQRLADQVERDPVMGWEWREGSAGRDELTPPVVLVDDEWCASPDDVLDLAGRVWSAGLEGLMIKDATAPYRRVRTPVWMKVKRASDGGFRLGAN